MLNHYWLVAGQVIFTIGDDQFNRSVNTLIVSKESYVTRVNMGRAQQALQLRVMQECFPENQVPTDLEIRDVFLVSISHLGQMTSEQFDQGYVDVVKARPSPAEIIRGLA